MSPEEAAKEVAKAVDRDWICNRAIGYRDHSLNLQPTGYPSDLYPDLEVTLWPEDEEVQVILYGKATTCPSAHLERHLTHLFKGLLKKEVKGGAQ